MKITALFKKDTFADVKSQSSKTPQELKRTLYRYRWVIFIILTTAYFFVYFHRISVGTVGKEIVADVGGTVGLLSTTYFWVYAAMQIPSGLLADHLGPRKAAFIFMMIATVGSFLTFLGTEFWMILLGKIMIAAGMAVIYIPLMKIISVWFGKKDFPQLAGIVVAVGNVGAIAATAPLDILADAVGWRNVFLLLGLVTLTIALLCYAFVRDHPHKMGLPAIEEIEKEEQGTHTTDATNAKISVVKGLITVFMSGRKFWTMAMAYFFVYGSIMVFQSTWATIYFNEVYDFALAASWLILALGIGKILSSAIIGILNGRGIVKSKRTAMFWGTLLFAATWGIIWGFAGEMDNYWFWMAICFVFGFSGGFMTLSYTQVREWYPTAISGTSVSALNFFLFLGAGVFTLITDPIIKASYTLGNFALVWGIMFIATVVALIMIALSVEKKDSDPLVGT
ncbi:sugar efflux transporter [Candidatus Methanoplasma termitum]|uniref:SotB protein n=1 Tax=Candidatus Methanoplasma termitum TaxID=1577791 RepID=A0A0A7LBM4_9ARCH|nr:MFS transporter [Candidatus Methanoplasma termitum]AIZ56469.1 sugar efflux transporter [Candidatus Methanoplasma termitum]MCL2334034.1 MFS transporter [Candidatus Methanoplasma sp.]